MCLTVSKTKCPFRGSCRSTITNNQERDEMVTARFIHDCYKDNKFTDVQSLPHSLIQLISKWYQNEQIYLFKHGDECHHKGGEHFTINVDDILLNTV